MNNRSQFFYIFLLIFARSNYGCEIEGIANWWLDVSVKDTDRGVFFQGNTEGISGISNAVHSGDNLNAGPYFTATLENSQFLLALNENFADYEEQETSQSMSISVTFQCTTGSSKNIVFIMSIIDTNNNAPAFTASEALTFRVTPPLPPGYELTGCLSDLNVRDIDLTTLRIEFDIEENDLVEIVYDADSSTEAKNFKAILKTTSFIRSLPEPVILRISATDVDLTGDPPLTTYANVRIESDGQFELPEEPRFSEPYYMATYSQENTLIFEEPIYLQQGYHTQIQFSLLGDLSNLFSLTTTDNSVTIEPTSDFPSSIPPDVRQIYLVITAERENTSGASTTVIIDIPQDESLQYEYTLYTGTIIDNILNLTTIYLSQGYSQNFDVAIKSEQTAYFSALINNNAVTISMSPLDKDIIEENNFLTLEVIASTDFSSATAVVNLEIIKEAIIKPEFEKRVYKGSYDIESGLVLEDIVLSHGYDSTVSYYVEGDSSQYFEINDSQDNIQIVLKSEIPEDVIFDKKVLTFSIVAEKPRTVGAHATVVVSFPKELTEPDVLVFTKNAYLGYLSNNNVTTIEEIKLESQYDPNTEFALTGDFSEYFSLINEENTLFIYLSNPLLIDTVTESVIMLEIVAQRPRSIAGKTILIIQLDQNVSEFLKFDEPFYKGTYSTEDGLDFVENMYLLQGYSDDVLFYLAGENSELFRLEQNDNSLKLLTQNVVPEEILTSHNHFLFTIIASKTGASDGISTIFIELVKEVVTNDYTLGFSSVYYFGTIDDAGLKLDPVQLQENYPDDIELTLLGDLNEYFSVTRSDENIIINLQFDLPESETANRNILIFILKANTETQTSHATIVVEIIKNLNPSLLFEQTYYTGTYLESEGLFFDGVINLKEQAADISLSLTGENSEWFTLEATVNGTTLAVTSTIPSEVLMNNYNLIFYVTANKNGGEETASATIIIALVSNLKNSNELRFEQNSYQGNLQNEIITLDKNIALEEIYDSLTLLLIGDLSEYFSVDNEGVNLSLTLERAIPTEIISSYNILVLEIHAEATNTIAGKTVVILEVIENSELMTLSFSESYYIGEYYQDALEFEAKISLNSGFENNLDFILEGDNSEWFTLEQSGNSAALSLLTPISDEVLADNNLIVFKVVAEKQGIRAEAIIIITLLKESRTIISESSFDKTLYFGLVNSDVVSHETISVKEGAGDILLYGTYSDSFLAAITNGQVNVILRPSVSFPESVAYVALELRFINSSAVLLLDIDHSEEPSIPEITFETLSSQILVDVITTGLVGWVKATASNGESISYALLMDNAHLKERIFISEEGAIHLTAFVNSGRYLFDVAATTTISKVTATASVLLIVEAVFSCEDTIRVHPLITLSVIEEEPHANLLVLNSSLDCWYTIEDSWPIDQDWVYVDSHGLHTRSIDREDARIAFMALSQVKIELLLHCEDDNTNRVKRSEEIVKPHWLGPYDYGTRSWILSDTISYNARRSSINLIVNDINDNVPLFENNEGKPLVVGYPVYDLLDFIEPDYVTKLEVNDADIGINAEVLFWTTSTEIAVSPTTGTVHIRDTENFVDSTTVKVFATDRLGAGLTGEKDLTIRLLNQSNIVVLTIQNAFLEEKSFLSDLSQALGFEIKSIKSIVTLFDLGMNTSERLFYGQKNTELPGVVLKLFIYGLDGVELKSASEIINNLTNNTEDAIVERLSLQDYLAARKQCIIAGTGRDIGLLVATIILSILLFILTVVYLVWIIRKRSTAVSYDNFSDNNSLNSGESALDKTSNENPNNVNIDEIKRTERRLQVMLDAPLTESNDSLVNIPDSPKPSVSNIAPEELNAPIVIQSYDKLKDAEDNEKDDMNEKRPRKKSVTFNENVERIIHLEDSLDDDGDGVTELYSSRL